MSTIPRRRRYSRSFDLVEARTLRFADGLVIQPEDCPQNIHARRHWIAPGVCQHNAPAPQLTTKPTQQRQCAICGTPTDMHWCSEMCRRADEGRVE